MVFSNIFYNALFISINDRFRYSRKVLFTSKRKRIGDDTLFAAMEIINKLYNYKKVYKAVRNMRRVQLMRITIGIFAIVDSVFNFNNIYYARIGV